jgi:hypothetical protein
MLLIMATAKKLIAFIGPMPGISQRGPSFCVPFVEIELGVWLIMVRYVLTLQGPF